MRPWNSLDWLLSIYWLLSLFVSLWTCYLSFLCLLFISVFPQLPVYGPFEVKGWGNLYTKLTSNFHIRSELNNTTLLGLHEHFINNDVSCPFGNTSLHSSSTHSLLNCDIATWYVSLLDPPLIDIISQYALLHWLNEVQNSCFERAKRRFQVEELEKDTYLNRNPLSLHGNGWRFLVGNSLW